MNNYKKCVSQIIAKGAQGKELHYWISNVVGSSIDKKNEITTMCIRNVIQIIVNELLNEQHIVVEERCSFWEKIKCIRTSIPSTIYNTFITCKDIGNGPSHAERVSKEECLLALESIRVILNWYMGYFDMDQNILEIYKQEELSNNEEKKLVQTRLTSDYNQLVKKYKELVKSHGTLDNEKQYLENEFKKIRLQKHQLEKEVQVLKQRKKEKFTNEIKKLELTTQESLDREKKIQVEYIEKLEREYAHQKGLLERQIKVANEKHGETEWLKEQLRVTRIDYENNKEKLIRESEIKLIQVEQKLNSESEGKLIQLTKKMMDETEFRIAQAEAEILLVEGRIREVEERSAREKKEIMKYSAEQSLMAIDEGKTAGVLKAYGQSLLKRTPEESAKAFKMRIGTYPRVLLGRAMVNAHILLESSIVPIDIIWVDTSYEKGELRFYISFDGVVDPSIFSDSTYFDIMGRYRVGDNY